MSSVKAGSYSIRQLSDRLKRHGVEECLSTRGLRDRPGRAPERVRYWRRDIGSGVPAFVAFPIVGSDKELLDPDTVEQLIRGLHLDPIEVLQWDDDE